MNRPALDGWPGRPAQQVDLSRDGDLLVITVGLGAVATTLMCGALAVDGPRHPLLGSTLPHDVGEALRRNAVRFAAFDATPRSAYEAALESGVLTREHVEPLRAALEETVAITGVTRATIASRGNRRTVEDLRRAVTKLRADAPTTDRAVMLIAMSTEPENEAVADAPLHCLLSDEGPPLSPTAAYVVAALLEGIPVANLTPNRCMELPCIQQLAFDQGLPIAGNDLKTGQTLLKTIIAPALRDRGLVIEGWYSTNILGNNDGISLSDAGAAATKVRTKTACLGNILQGAQEKAPDHVVRIDYYPPRGDNKESWDCIDFRGWLGYPMSLRLNLHCRDSILAAPLAFDLALLLDASKKAGRAGPQRWLGSFFKLPVSCASLGVPTHAFPAQQAEFVEVAAQVAAQRRVDGIAGQALAVFEEAFRTGVSQHIFHPTEGLPQDVDVERWVYGFVRERLPGIGCIGEECGITEGDGEFSMLVDPVDGSYNSARGIPASAICLTLIAGELCLDAARATFVGNLATGESYSHAAAPCRTPAVTKRALAFDFDGTVDIGLLERLRGEYPHLRRLGSTVLELTLVARGSIDAFVDVRGTLRPENFVGPAFMITAAGGAFIILDEGINSGTHLDMQRGYCVAAVSQAQALPRLLALLRWEASTET